MKLIIAGSRTLDLSPILIVELMNHFKISPNEIVSGRASGVDKSGERYAYYELIDITHFPADWDTHGKAAGPIRNKQMADYSDALLLIWDGKSKGSSNMKKEMLKLKKPIYEVILNGPTN